MSKASPMAQVPVHSLTKSQIKRFALARRKAGEYYDTQNEELEDTFHGSIDRFCDIAVAFRYSRSVLDVGSGNGLLKMLGHDAHAVDLWDRSTDTLYVNLGIPFQTCNIEADPLPFDSESLDAVSCCQAFEHFTHSHLKPLL